MSEIVKIYADKSVAMRSWDPLYRDAESKEVIISSRSEDEYVSGLLLHFSLPTKYLYQSLIGGVFYVFGTAIDVSSYLKTASLILECPRDGIDFNSVTYSTLGKVDNALHSSYIDVYQGDKRYISSFTTTSPVYYFRKIVYRGLLLAYSSYDTSIAVDTSLGTHPPYIEFEFGTGQCSAVPQSTIPSAGATVPHSMDSVFSVEIGYNDSGISLYLPIASAVLLRWRVKDSGTYTEIDLGDKTSCTIPANTFPKGDIEYQFVITDSGGSTSESAWVEISTEDTVPTARPISPIATLVDSTVPVAFMWQHVNSSGTPQSKAELQISDDGSTWDALIVSIGAATEVTIPSGSFTSGTHYWRVRTYNQDDAPGAWSESAQFEAVGSPPAPIIATLDTSPRPAVVWQTSEQEAWRLVFNGEATTRYGDSKDWRCPTYVEDGEYAISIQTQNQYGIWGAITQNVFYVTNTPGEEISLSVLTGGASAVLTWTATGYDFFIVYRDGVAIAKVSEKSYVDYFSSGKCSYRVRGCYDDSNNYGLSSAVEAEVHSDSPVIIDAETHELLWLELSEQQHRTFSHTLSRQAASYHVTGRALPSVDITEFRDESLSLSCAFWEGDTDAQRRLESMIGRTVCLKTGTGERAIGALNAVSKSVQMFYTTYQLSVTNSDYEEEVPL